MRSDFQETHMLSPMGTDLRGTSPIGFLAKLEFLPGVCQLVALRVYDSAQS
ncbi:hypothetical protein CGRA01v4_06883 [Colletotrichum graminicola]|nr:hypothetical protein CGRA01v4_06883 [Colletotrichum graminicola]